MPRRAFVYESFEGSLTTWYIAALGCEVPFVESGLDLSLEADVGWLLMGLLVRVAWEPDPRLD